MFFPFSAESRGDRDEDDEMRWEEAENEVGHLRFPGSFFDSVRTANGIPDNRGLRKYGKLPFTGKEKLVFDGGWGFIRAGYAILEAGNSREDPSILLLSGKVVTNNFVSAFYKVRDFVLSVTDAQGLYPYTFEQDVREGKYRTRRWTVYDHVNGRVYDNKKRDEPFEISMFSQNYLSLLYYLRTFDVAPGDTFSINCFVHGKDYPYLFKVVEREEIKVDAGRFKCLKIEPRLMGEGRGFTKRDKMTIWVTDDEYHMPVCVKAKIALGSLSAKLLYYER